MKGSHMCPFCIDCLIFCALGTVYYCTSACQWAFFAIVETADYRQSLEPAIVVEPEHVQREEWGIITPLSEIEWTPVLCSAQRFPTCLKTYASGSRITELAKKVCPWLRDSACWRSGEITQPRTTVFGQLCSVYFVLCHKAEKAHRPS